MLALSKAAVRLGWVADLAQLQARELQQYF